MQVLHSSAEMRSWQRTQSLQGREIGFVPTMGYLHDGHLSLINELRASRPGLLIVASIFVNPTQFGPNEDLERYPVDIEGDSNKLRQRGVDALFLPQVDDLYPGGVDAAAISLHGGPLMQSMCAIHRPVHFPGVLAVVARLFNIVRPDYAAFGQKDFQQLRLIEQLVTDFAFPVTIIRGTTIREADGLAMSSRNAYLTQEQRAIAPMLRQRLLQLGASIHADYNAVSELCQAAVNDIHETFGAMPDYLECRAESDLSLVTTYDPRQPARLFVAAQLGLSRLIDNCSIQQECSL